MKPPHQMSPTERREHLELWLTNAEYMLKMERSIASSRSWSQERRLSAEAAIPDWQRRVTQLKEILK